MCPQGPRLTNGTVYSPFSRNSRTSTGKNVSSWSPFSLAKTGDRDVIPDQAACVRSEGEGREAAREPNSRMFILQLLPNALSMPNKTAALLCRQFTQPLASSQVPHRERDAA